MPKAIHDMLAWHPFFAGIAPATLEVICGCGKNVRFEEGEYICHEGDPSLTWYAIREGNVALEVPIPGREAAAILTLRDGDILGWSWLFPPYRWVCDAVAVERTRAVEFDGECLRTKCENDTAMGYDLMKRFAAVFAKRLEAARLQIMDVYGTT